MITQFKIFENQQDKPQLGDYVKVYGDYFDVSLIDFFKTHIGRLIEIEENEYPYIIEFEEEVPIRKIYKMGFTEDEIIEWNKDEDFFKMKDAANKYNL